MCVCVCVCARAHALLCSQRLDQMHTGTLSMLISQQPLQVKATNIVEMMGIKGLVKVMLILKNACLLQLIKRTGLLLHYKVNLVIAFKSLKKYRTFYFLAKKMRVTIYTHINIYL